MDYGQVQKDILSMLTKLSDFQLGAIVLSDIIPIEIRGTYQSWINLTWGLGSMLVIPCRVYSVGYEVAKG